MCWTQGLFVHCRMRCHAPHRHSPWPHLLVWTGQFPLCQVYPVCLEKGMDREGAADTVWDGCGSRPCSLRPCWGPGLLRVSSLRQRSLHCTNEDPKDIFCNSGVCSLFEYKIIQNVAWEACKMAAAGHGVHLLYQEDKTAAVTTPCKAPRVTMVF